MAPVAPLHRRSTLSVVWVIAAVATAAVPRAAHADVTSWLAVGGGGGFERNHATRRNSTSPAMTYSIGVGSSPAARFVVGGLLRGTTFFDLGTDLGIAARVSTGGFARGDWGVAVDAGALWRPWLQDYGQWPLQAVVTGGSPWGFQLAVGADFWSVSGGTPAQGVFATLELDLLRLTVMRQGGSERWWHNPDPAGGHMAESATSTSP